MSQEIVEPAISLNGSDTFGDETKPFDGRDSEIAEFDDTLDENPMDYDSDQSFKGSSDRADRSSEYFVSILHHRLKE